MVSLLMSLLLLGLSIGWSLLASSNQVITKGSLACMT